MTKKKIYFFFKRLFDICFSLFVISILFLPLMIIIKIVFMIFKDYSSIFYTQYRIGKNGKLFKLIKFRTMVVNADSMLNDLLESDEKLKQEFLDNRKLGKDPRITRVGKYLRNTCLDEFPQFINVFLGQMSVIGYRPYLPEELDNDSLLYNKMMQYKPGITGYWQVEKPDKTFETRQKLDYYYIDNFSLKLDVRIAIKTIKLILRKILWGGYMNKKILLSSPTMHGEELEFVKQAFDKNWVAPIGFNIDNLQTEMDSFLGGDVYTVALSSGTAAIHTALIMSNIQNDDVVLCQDLTFVASANPILYQNAKPVFVDSEFDTLNMSPEALEKAFEKYPNAKAVIVVHLYGIPAKLDEIKAICDKHNAVLIEDATESLSATYKGKQTGTFGNFGVISFNGNKIITASTGGMIITKNEQEKARALFLSNQAKEDQVYYYHKEVGYNYRMSNIDAGIARGQLLHLLEHKALKEKIYQKYSVGLKDLPVKMNPYLLCSSPNFWLSCIVFDASTDKKPIDLFYFLQQHNIDSRPCWRPMHTQPLFENYDFVSVFDSAVSERIYDRTLCLPSDIKMTEDEQNLVIEKIKEFFNK